MINIKNIEQNINHTSWSKQKNYMSYPSPEPECMGVNQGFPWFPQARGLFLEEDRTGRDVRQNMKVTRDTKSQQSSR